MSNDNNQTVSQSVSAYINKEILFDKSITNEDICTLLLLNYLYSNKNDYIYFSLNQLIYLLYNDFGNVKYNRAKVVFKDTINNLISKGIISLISRYSDEYVITSKEVFISGKGNSTRFVSIKLNEIQSIFSLNNHINKFKLLRYFLVKISTINNKSKLGFTSIETLSSITNIDKSSAISYNDMLEKLCLLIINRHSTNIKHDDGTIKKMNNTYYRPCDNSVAKLYFTDNTNTSDSGDISINRRSIKAKYNHFVKGKSRGDVKELYDLCVRYNDSLSDGDIGAGMSRLDLDIFNNNFNRV